MLSVFVLSLPSAEGRRRTSSAALESLGIPFNFFNAVNGKALSADERSRHYDARANSRDFKRPLSAGEIGCYMGHLQMWSVLAESGENAALILEDDFQFTRDPTPFLREIAKYELSDVLLKLDADSPRRSRKLQQIGDTWLSTNDLVPPRTTGYIIGARAAVTLLERRQRFSRPIDIDLKHHWEHGVPVMQTENALVRERDGNVSSLDAVRVQNKPDAWARFWRNLNYKAAFRKGMRAANSNAITQLTLNSEPRSLKSHERAPTQSEPHRGPSRRPIPPSRVVEPSLRDPDVRSGR